MTVDAVIEEENMKTEVRVRPWHLALISLSGGAIGALVFAAFTPARIESQMDGALPSFAALAQEVMPAVVNINTTKNIPARTQRRQFPRGQDPFEQFFGEDFWDRFGNGRGRGPSKQRSLGSGGRRQLREVAQEQARAGRRHAYGTRGIRSPPSSAAASASG